MQTQILQKLWDQFIAEPDIFDWIKKQTKPVFPSTPSNLSVNMLALLEALLKYSVAEQIFYSELVYEKVFMYCMAWSIGGLYEREEQIKFHDKLFSLSEIDWTPYAESSNDDKPTIYEFYVNLADFENQEDDDAKEKDGEPDWKEWKAPTWTYPDVFRFSECLIPTRDSVRAEFLLQKMSLSSNYPTLVLGSSGTGKRYLIS